MILLYFIFSASLSLYVSCDIVVCQATFILVSYFSLCDCMHNNLGYCVLWCCWGGIKTLLHPLMKMPP